MTAATVTALSYARALAAETEAARPSWAASREAAGVIGWALDALAETLAVCQRLEAGDVDPLSIGAPDAGWWGDPEAQALEYAQDQAAQCAIALRKRLAEYQDRTNSSEGGTG